MGISPASSAHRSSNPGNWSWHGSEKGRREFRRTDQQRMLFFSIRLLQTRSPPSQPFASDSPGRVMQRSRSTIPWAANLPVCWMPTSTPENTPSMLIAMICLPVFISCSRLEPAACSECGSDSECSIFDWGFQVTQRLDLWSFCARAQQDGNGRSAAVVVACRSARLPHGAEATVLVSSKACWKQAGEGSVSTLH